MIYREYGKTGKKVSLLGFGGSRFASSACRSLEGRQGYADLIIAAHEAGVNYFDTAPGYCEGMSEQVFGCAFSRLRASGKTNFYVSTKSSSSADPTADAVRRRIELSLRALNVDAIHFFHMWGILTMEQYRRVIAPGGPYWGAVKAREEGLIEHICFSTHCSGEEIEEIIGQGYFEGVTLGYNIINFPFRERGLSAAQRHTLGVAVMNPLGGGVIPHNPRYFSFICDREQSPAEAALAFVAGHEAVSVVLSGMISGAELAENLAGVTGAASFSPERIALLKMRVREEFDTLCTGCRYCAGCPEGIEVHKPMLGYNRYILNGGDAADFLEEMAIAWGAPYRLAYACADCGLCESKCTQHLPIRERLAHVNALYAARPSSKKEALDRCFSPGKAGRKTGVYAVGTDALAMLRHYEEVYGRPDFPLFLFDSDPKKWGSEPAWPGFPVRPPAEVEELGIERLIIASRAYHAEISASLAHLEKKGLELVRYDPFSEDTL